LALKKFPPFSSLIKNFQVFSNVFFEIDDRGVLSGIFSEKRGVAHDFLDIVYDAI